MGADEQGPARAAPLAERLSHEASDAYEVEEALLSIGLYVPRGNDELRWGRQGATIQDVHGGTNATRETWIRTAQTHAPKEETSIVKRARKKRLDVSISGRMGLYDISPLTAGGKRWVKRYLRGAVASPNGHVWCEGGQECRAIVRGMDDSGLRVEVNGVDMAGFSRTG